MWLMLLAVVHALADTELVSRFQAGDQSAFSHIVQRYQDRVYTVCLRFMRDRQVAEDVAQDVFLALYRSLHTFRGDSALSTWVFRVAVNHCKNRRLYRSRRHLDRHEPLEGTGPDDGPKREIAADGPSADAALAGEQARALLWAALDRLDDEQRSIIVLRDVQDLSYEEIADILELPRGTVKSRLHRARSQLAAVLARTLAPEDIV